MSEWSDWKSFKKNHHEKIDKEFRAVYKIRLKPALVFDRLKHKRGIPRLFGVDEDCILTIGKAENLQRRIRLFKNAMKQGEEINHSEGRTLFLINKVHHGNQIKLEDLEYIYRKVDDPEAAERDEFIKYFEKYGEVPPLNASNPGRSKLLKRCQKDK